MESKFIQGSKKIILASASPRRKEILESMGLDFDIMTSDVNESLPFGASATDAVKELSLRKAEAVQEKYPPDCIIIGSDTLLEFEGKALGKPKDESDALDMLLSLSGKLHFVHTGIALCYKGRSLVELDTTSVYMKPYTKDDALAYIKTGEPMDKAGSYAIQGIGSRLVDRIEGDFDNVVGLPSRLLLKMLTEITK